MSILKLPTETVLKIFNLLHCNDLKICGEVCSNWKILANEVSEMKWKCMCKRDFPKLYEDAHRKANLSWEELHNSLKSWPQVKTCKVYSKYSKLVETRYVPVEDKELKKLHFLSNGTIGYPYYIVEDWEPEHFTGECYKFNCICYYNAKTLELIDSVNYNFNFDIYIETDDMIVLRTTEFIDDSLNEMLKICIYTKPDKCLQVSEELSGLNSRIFVNKKKVFYMTVDGTLWMSKVIVEAGRTTLESVAIAPPEACEHCGMCNIQAVTCSSDTQVKVLSEQGDIFSILNQEVSKLCHIETRDRNAVMDVLNQHSFFWNAPEVYNWMCTKKLSVTHLKDAIVYSYHDVVVIVGTIQRVLHIYYNPYRKKHLKIFKASPTLKIDLNGWVPSNGAWPRYVCDSQKRINQIEVVEIKGGHRIIMLYCQRLVAVELRSGSLKRPNRELEDLVGMSDGEYTRIA